jgi:hypothetical protein
MTELGGVSAGGAHEGSHDGEPRQRARLDDPTRLRDTTYDDLPVEDEEAEDVVGLGPVFGIGIVLATFVLTFLAIFFGIPYLAGLPIRSRFPESLQGSPPPVVSSRVPEPAFVGPLLHKPAPMVPPERRPKRVEGHAEAPARLPSTPTREAVRNAPGNAAVPASTPAIPRPALRPTRPQVEPEAAEPERSASAVRKDDAWVRGAAFADREAAERLAASIARQGYPAKVRREDAPTTLWVVWIGQRQK